MFYGGAWELSWHKTDKQEKKMQILFNIFMLTQESSKGKWRPEEAIKPQSLYTF